MPMCSFYHHFDRLDFLRMHAALLAIFVSSYKKILIPVASYSGTYIVSIKLSATPFWVDAEYMQTWQTQGTRYHITACALIGFQ